MTPDKIIQSLEFPFSPERVWQAITRPEELVRWFSNRVQMELVVGGEVVFEWDGYPASEGVIERIEPPHVFAFRWRSNSVASSGPVTPENSTLVTFTVTPTATGARLEVTEVGFANLPAEARARAYQENDGGWKAELADLVDYLK